ncbi:MAG: hypothetical protein QT05_C0002G0009 [archaeon GW2011_AR13]|nr:MAG: hypothetical protein QT05_C0002G0009 [archaeon GW2011_AR13]HIG93983.1 hypothetical protein [Nanoarchaeota archaeon]HIH63825.1 hypothetical protein [Nanoarchaeota archaeon]HIJ09110.1 hypothetical protein [Nanoarchaeota archaeon]
MIPVGNIKYKNYNTLVKISNSVKKLLEEVNLDLDLTKRFPNSEYFYENFLFLKPHLRKHKNFELIYLDVFEDDSTCPSLEKIKENLSCEILLDGSLKNFESGKMIRWIVVENEINLFK